MNTIIDYSEGCYSTIFYLYLRVLGFNSIEIDHVASHIGKAFGILILLRSTLYHAKNNITYLPASVCLKHNVTEEDIYQGNDTINLENVIFEIADTAKTHLDFVRDHQKEKVESKIYSALKPPIIWIEMILNILEKNNFNIYKSNFQIDDIRFNLQLKLTYKYYFNDLKL